MTPRIFCLSLSDTKVMLAHDIGLTPEYVASWVVDSPAATPSLLLVRGLTGTWMRGAGKLMRIISLLALPHATHLPKRELAW